MDHVAGRIALRTADVEVVSGAMPVEKLDGLPQVAIRESVQAGAEWRVGAHMCIRIVERVFLPALKNQARLGHQLQTIAARESPIAAVQECVDQARVVVQVARQLDITLGGMGRREDGQKLFDRQNPGGIRLRAHQAQKPLEHVDSFPAVLRIDHEVDHAVGPQHAA